jgi:hypothetical protein
MTTHGTTAPELPAVPRRPRLSAQPRSLWRSGALPFAAAGVLFAAYPALRPYADEATLQGAQAMASGRWVAAHVAAMLAFVLLAVGVASLSRRLHRGPGARAARHAVTATTIAVALMLPYYGAETFALQVITARAAENDYEALLGVVEAVRFGPTQAVMFLAGLILLAIGAALTARATARSTTLARWSGLPLAVGMALLLPQFYGPPAVRVAHGLLVAAGAFTLATELWRTPRSART